MQPCREFKSAIKEIAALIRESALVRHLGRPIRILREISKVAEKGKEGRRQIARVAEAPHAELARRARAATLAPVLRAGAARVKLRGAESRLREVR